MEAQAQDAEEERYTRVMRRLETGGITQRVADLLLGRYDNLTDEQIHCLWTENTDARRLH